MTVEALPKGSDRIHIHDSAVLANDWGVLTKYWIDFTRSDGTTQSLTRETYDRGDGATILLYNPDHGTVILTRQLRFPAFIKGYSDDLIEACAGLLDRRDPEATIRSEAEEEAGVEVGAVEKIWEVFMSPGSVTERLHFFVAPYASMQTGSGRGVAAEGEDIAVIELPLKDALAMIDRGEIIDAKTIMLLQHAALKGLCGPI